MEMGVLSEGLSVREALEISSPLALVSREVPRFHSRSLYTGKTQSSGSCLK